MAIPGKYTGSSQGPRSTPPGAVGLHFGKCALQAGNRPTSASWLNAIENFFSKMTRQREFPRETGSHLAAGGNRIRTLGPSRETSRFPRRKGRRKRAVSKALSISPTAGEERGVRRACTRDRRQGWQTTPTGQPDAFEDSGGIMFAGSPIPCFGKSSIFTSTSGVGGV
jgi:hypothetical protein